MASRRGALSGNASLIATFSSYIYVNTLPIVSSGLPIMYDNIALYVM